MQSFRDSKQSLSNWHITEYTLYKLFDRILQLDLS